MKLGLITDIHEQVEHLAKALNRFAEERVDRVVVIGDLVEMGPGLLPTCKLLSEAAALGVWGNHDFGLCVDPDEETSARYGPVVMSYMASLRPRIVIDDCHFSHVEPWLNPEKVEDLWYFDGAPEEHRSLARIFNAAPHRLFFVGHYHQWLLATPDQITDWRGEQPIYLQQGRYFVVVGPLCEGCFATFDTKTYQLTPYRTGA